MSKDRAQHLAAADNPEFIRTLFLAQLERGDLELPVLPEVAARVVSFTGSPDADAAGLARLITADQSLAAHVMRVATSAIYQPRNPIESLQQAITWLGMAEVSEIAFSVAVQGKLLNVPGQKARVQQMWKQAVATALWSRVVADAAGKPGEASYLSGLLHEIGRPACLQALVEFSRRAKVPLSDPELDALVGEFHVEVGVQLAARWKLPSTIGIVIRWWRDWVDAPERRDACAIVNLAHSVAGHMLAGSAVLAAEELASDPVAAHLGLGPDDIVALCAQSERLQGLVEG